jgi:DNA polymerase V
LLIDRSLKPKKNDLVLAVIDGEFKVIKFPEVFLETEFVLWGLISYIIHYAR